MATTFWTVKLTLDDGTTITVEVTADNYENAKANARAELGIDKFTRVKKYDLKRGEAV